MTQLRVAGLYLNLGQPKLNSGMASKVGVFDCCVLEETLVLPPGGMVVLETNNTRGFSSFACIGIVSVWRARVFSPLLAEGRLHEQP